MVTISFSKRDFVWIGLIIVLLSVGFGVATWDNSKAMFHDSEDVKVNVDGIDYSLQNATDLGLFSGQVSYDQTNCDWMESPRCGTWSNNWIDTTCPDGKFAAGVGISGCSWDGCADASRCQTSRVYCCG